MTQLTMYAANLLAVSVLVFGLFLRRHRRPELVVAYLTTNVGVLAVTTTLTTSAVGVGLGLGLFGILSIIRLRSEELTQTHIAYYFAALTLGLLAGLEVTPQVTGLGLMGLVLLAVAIGDHPRVAPRLHSEQLLLDRAYLDRTALHARVEEMLGATLVSAKVVRTDVVNDTTLVEVRYRPSAVDLAATSGPAEVTR